MKFRDLLEKKIGTDDIIKSFRKNKIIVKMADYGKLVGRMDMATAKEIMKDFDIKYDIKQGRKDKELVYIYLFE